MIALRSGSATDVGLVRSNNQDRLLEANPLFAVADGMGGAAAGEVASATAIDALQEWFAGLGTPTPDDLLRGAEKANRAVWDRAEANPEMRGMGTTLVSVALVESGKVAIANVGDSRVYALHHGVLRQVTEDHNLVAEMVAQGRLSAEEAEFHPRRNIMTRALGVEPAVPVDLFLEEAEPGVRYLLCSDGLPREIKDDQIASILRRLSDPAEAAKELVDEAIRKGGNDNITVVIVDVVDLSGEEGDATSVVPETPADVPEERTRVRRSLRRGERRSERPPPVRLLTPRVVAFILLLVLIVGGGAVGVAWYARSGYFVGLRGQEIIVFKGRPGGVLWWKPTVAEATSTSTGDIEIRHVQDLRAGVAESSLAAASQFVQSLVVEKQQAEAAALPPTPATPATPATTVPSRSAPTTS
jgi:serine/threonine protein phosphatase PrpC